ncbi:hypothetical protein GIB67_041496 [Kingdonia uniflora]|uniref:Uncharacterized protein n=1 Tax=Kingdonia uniflora TaxID=39325 RepID=A0A7J7MQ18_9MAGN|nr:hypothetical protein GIB67_041496 [Kingdonia uniflora]
MVKTRSQRVVEARVLNDLRLTFKIDEIREAIFGQQGYVAVLLETRANYEGKTDAERGAEMNCVYWSQVHGYLLTNLAKRKAIKRGVIPRSATLVSVDDSSKRRKFVRALRDVQLGFQDRSMELEKRISQLEEEKNQLEENLTRERGAFQFEREKEREAAALKLNEVKAERNLYQLWYTKAEIMAFSEGNYEEMKILNEEEVEEREDGLNVAERPLPITRKLLIRHRCCESLLNVMQKELDVAREREEQTLLNNTEYVEEYEVLFSQDLALNQLTSELAELKEKDVSGSRHEAELAEYRIRALNEEISDMKCNIHALNEQLLKREIELDTAQTNLAVSEANFENLSSSIMGKDRELCNSVQIRDGLIARLDRLKASLRPLKGRETQSRADLAEIQAKNQSLVDDLAHARGNMRRVVQREKEMNERINQLCARISKSERELRVHEMKYQKDLKFELDKGDGKIASCKGSREMKEFLRRKEELVENLCIDLTNFRQKSIDLARQICERIDQLTTELAESKTHRLRN